MCRAGRIAAMIAACGCRTGTVDDQDETECITANDPSAVFDTGPEGSSPVGSDEYPYSFVSLLVWDSDPIRVGISMETTEDGSKVDVFDVLSLHCASCSPQVRLYPLVPGSEDEVNRFSADAYLPVAGSATPDPAAVDSLGFEDGSYSLVYHWHLDGTPDCASIGPFATALARTYDCDTRMQQDAVVIDRPEW